MTHIVEVNRGHLHQTERQHGISHFQAHPDLWPRVLRAESEHEQAARGDYQAREAGRQPTLWLGEAVALVLGLAEQPRVGSDISECRAYERSDDWADVDQTGVCAPEIYSIIVS